MRNNSVLHRALPIVAAALGKKLGVKVVMQGQTACTNGNTIYLPALKSESEHAPALWGYLTHEAAHVRFTDFDCVRQANRISPLAGSLHNILEDGVIEREIAKVYPGAVKSLRDTAEHLVQEKLWMDVTPETAPGMSPEAILSGYILFHVRCNPELANQAPILEGYRDRFRAAFLQAFGLGTLQGLEAILDRAGGNLSTSDTLDMTKEILAYLNLQAEAQQPDSGNPKNSDQNDPQQSASDDDDDSPGKGGGTNDQNEDSSSDDNAESGSDDSQGAQDGSDDSDQDSGASSADGSDADSADDSPEGSSASDAAGSDAGDDGGDASSGGDSANGQDDSREADSDADGAAAAADSAGASASGGTPTPDQQDALKQSLEAADDSKMAGDVLQPLQDAIEKEVRKTGTDNAASSIATAHQAGESFNHVGEGNALDLEARSLTRKLRQQLQGLVQTSRLDREITGRRGRNLSTRRLCRMKMGDTRVFSRREETLAPDTAIHLLVDASGSMGGERAQMASVATYGLAISLQSIERVAVTASSFCGGSTVVRSILEHGEQARRQPGTFLISPQGGTPLAPGVWHGLKSLIAAGAERSVLIVLTDGGAGDYPEAADAIRKARQAGVELYGVGIQELAHPELFDDSVTVTDVRLLGKELFQLARRKLITG